SNVGFEASIISNNPLDGDLVRFDLHGQAVSNQGFGLYGTLPFATLSGRDGAAVVDDFEVGGVWIPRLSGNLRLIVHGGITLPTGTNGIDNVINRVSSGPRIADDYLSLPRA